MAVTLKSKTKKATAVKPVVSEDLHDALMMDAADIVDEIAPVVKEATQLENQLKALNEKITKAKADLLALVKVMEPPPDQKVAIVGKLMTAEVTKDAEKREITDKDLLVETFDSIEEGLAIKLANFLLKDVDAYLTPTQIENVVSKHYTGKRLVKFKG